MRKFDILASQVLTLRPQRAPPVVHLQVTSTNITGISYP